MKPGTFAYVHSWQRLLEAGGWWHSFELPDGRSIRGVTPIADLQERIGQFPIPDDLHGARVLDIGAWDGWFSFEMERRGAEVLAIDCWDNPRFHQMRRLLKSRVAYRQMDIYELTPESVGRFDIVLFMGVLYHPQESTPARARTGLRALDRAGRCRFVRPPGETPPGPERGEPARDGVLRNRRIRGTTRQLVRPEPPVSDGDVPDRRLRARRTPSDADQWGLRRLPPEVGAGDRNRAASRADRGLSSYELRHRILLTRNTTNTLRSSSACRRATEPTIEGTKPQVGEYGVRPYYVEKKEGGKWQANFKLPPGMTSGWHDVIVRIGGAASNPARIAVDVPVPPLPIRIHGVRDGKTWEPGVFNPANGNVLSAWVSDLPDNADRANVRAVLAGEPLPVHFISPFGTETRQVNIPVPRRVSRMRRRARRSGVGRLFDGMSQDRSGSRDSNKSNE